MSLHRWMGVSGLVGLVLLGSAYWLTVEPAPRVRVLWAPDITPQQQTALERKYLLRHARDQLPEGSFAYDLLDTSTANIRALVRDPVVVDTNDIERNSLTIPFDVDYGDSWMWMAHRIPGLRVGWARAAVILTLAAMAVGGLARDGVRAWRAVRRAVRSFD